MDRFFPPKFANMTVPLFEDSGLVAQKIHPCMNIQYSNTIASMIWLFVLFHAKHTILKQNNVNGFTDEQATHCLLDLESSVKKKMQISTTENKRGTDLATHSTISVV